MNCRLTNYVNSLDYPMDYNVGSGEVITGVFSYYSSRTRYVMYTNVQIFVLKFSTL